MPIIFFGIALSLLLGLGGYWYYTSRRRIQRILLIREDRSIVEQKLRVETRYMGKRKVGEPAWLMIHKLLMPFKGGLIALCTERDAFPCDPFHVLDKGEINKLGDIQAIAREHLKNDRSKDIVNQTNRMTVYAIGLMVGVVAIIVLILGIVLIVNNVDMGELFRNLGGMWGGG